MNISIILSNKSAFKLNKLVEDCNETLKRLGCEKEISPETYLASLIDQAYYQMQTTK